MFCPPVNILRCALCVLLAQVVVQSTAFAQVTIIAPAQGVAVNGGETVRIEWQVTPQAVPVNLAYTDDEGRSWKLIATDQRGQIYDWLVPASVTDKVLIRAARSAGGDPTAVREIAHARDEIRCLRFSASGDRLLSAARSGAVDVYNPLDGSLIGSVAPPAPAEISYQAQFLADDVQLVFTQGNALYHAADYSSAPIRLDIPEHQNFIRAVDAHPQRMLTVSADNGGVVAVFDIVAGTTLKRFEAAGDRLYDVRFSSSGRYIIYAGDRGLIYVRDWQSEAPTDAPAYVGGTHGIISERPDGTLDTNSRLIWSVAMNEEESWLASAGADRTIRRWNFGAGIPEATEIFTGHAAPVWSTAIVPRGDRLLSGSLDASIRQWDPYGSFEIGPTLIHGGQVLTIDYTSTRDLIASAGRDPFIKIWESGYSAAAADTVELVIGRREIVLRIPDIVSRPDNFVTIPVILENRDELQLDEPIQLLLTLESPRTLADIQGAFYDSALPDYGELNALTDTLDLTVEIDGTTDTLNFYPVRVLHGTPTTQPINFRRVQALTPAAPDIVQIDGSLSIEDECNDGLSPRELVLTGASTLQIVDLAPNPADLNITLSWRYSGQRSLILAILDNQGAVIRRQELDNSGGNSVLLDVGALQQGQYFVRLSDGRQSIGRKFVVLR